jgi:hypothetical protein
MKAFIIILIASGASLGIASGEYGAPVIFNCSSRLVDVSIKRPDAKTVKVGLPPHQDLWQPLKGVVVTELRLGKSPAKLYGPAQLDAIRSGREVGAELWVIKNSGIELHDLSEIKSIRAACSEK